MSNMDGSPLSWSYEDEMSSRELTKLQQENAQLQRRVDVFERAKRIWERRNGDRSDLMDASQEAQHYNWLEEQNEKLEQQVAEKDAEIDHLKHYVNHGHEVMHDELKKQLQAAVECVSAINKVIVIHHKEMSWDNQPAWNAVCKLVNDFFSSLQTKGETNGT